MAFTKETEPTSTFTKETEPTSSFTKETEPTSSFSKEQILVVDGGVQVQDSGVDVGLQVL